MIVVNQPSEKKEATVEKAVKAQEWPPLPEWPAFPPMPDWPAMPEPYPKSPPSYRFEIIRDDLGQISGMIATPI